MAHVKVYRDPHGCAAFELNGIDLTREIISDSVRITSTGGDEFDEVCVELKVALSRLDIGEHENVDAALLVGSSLVRMAAEVSA